MLREEVEEAVHSLKAGKSPEVDNIPSKLVKNGGEATTAVRTAICGRQRNSRRSGHNRSSYRYQNKTNNKKKKKGEKKRQQKCRTISQISHASQIMLRVILNRLNVKTEELPAMSSKVKTIVLSA